MWMVKSDEERVPNTSAFKAMRENLCPIVCNFTSFNFFLKKKCFDEIVDFYLKLIIKLHKPDIGITLSPTKTAIITRLQEPMVPQNIQCKVQWVLSDYTDFWHQILEFI